MIFTVEHDSLLCGCNNKNLTFSKGSVICVGRFNYDLAISEATGVCEMQGSVAIDNLYVFLVQRQFH